MLNKIFSVMVLTFVTVVGFFMYKEQDLGYLHITFAGFDHETNLLAAMTVGLLLLFAAIVIKHLLVRLGRVVSWFGSDRHLRLAEKATRSMMLGLVELAEGRFQNAEKHLLTQIKHNDNAVLAYLGAARAAQQQNAYQRRDKYLRLAHERQPEADTAIRLTRVELQMSQHQLEQALATLVMMHDESPNNTYVLKLLAEVYHELGEWDRLQGVVLELKKMAAMPAQELSSLEHAVWRGRMSRMAAQNDTEALIPYWSTLPVVARKDVALTLHYAQLLIDSACHDEAERVLRSSLSNQWDEDIIALYSTLDVVTDNKQLAAGEKWLQQHPNNEYLLLAMGNMCAGRKLWGKAEGYYEASISVRPTPRGCLRLAQLLEKDMDQADRAQRYYRQGLLLLEEDGSNSDGQTEEETLRLPHLTEA